MIYLENNSTFLARLFFSYSFENQPQYTCVIKKTFAFDYLGKLEETGNHEIEVIDRYYNNDLNQSLCAAEESMPEKFGSEILLYGTAQIPDKKSKITRVILGLNNQAKNLWEKQIFVFGKRYWIKGIFGDRISDPEYLLPTPIRYEFAYGGTDKEESVLENPIGKGFCQSKYYDGLLLPQLELGNPFISSVSQRVTPAGFSAIPRYYQPRLQAQIDLHQQKIANQNFYNVAQIDQQIKDRLIGGEKIYFSGLLKNIEINKKIYLTVPTIKPKVKFISNNKEENKEIAWDTISIDTDHQILNMIGRITVPYDLEKSGKAYFIID